MESQEASRPEVPDPHAWLKERMRTHWGLGDEDGVWLGVTPVDQP